MATDSVPGQTSYRFMFDDNGGFTTFEAAYAASRAIGSRRGYMPSIHAVTDGLWTTVWMDSCGRRNHDSRYSDLVDAEMERAGA